MKLKTIKIISVIGIFSLSFLSHFIYDLFPNVISSIFFPVNESIWEHMKLLVTPVLIFSVFEYIIYKRKNINFNNFLLSYSISMILGIVIYLIIYLPINYIFGHMIIVAISLLFLVIIIIELVSYYIMNSYGYYITFTEVTPDTYDAPGEDDDETTEVVQNNYPHTIYMNLNNGTIDKSMYGGSNKKGDVFANVYISLYKGNIVNEGYGVYGGGKGNEIQVTSWRKFKRCISKAIKNQVFAKTITDSEVDLTEEIANNLRANQVMVIDIARLDENTQSFVFGSVARSIYDLKLGAERDNVPDKVIIFVDELNKYASNDIPKNSPILRQLLEITERGRSLGIILFSVEQFRSAIHDRVKGNCATHAYGRTNAIEVSKADYKFVPKVYQNMMTRLSPGEYIISNPALRSLVNIKFPRPTYKQFPNG